MHRLKKMIPNDHNRKTPSEDEANRRTQLTSELVTHCRLEFAMVECRPRYLMCENVHLPTFAEVA